MAFTVVYDANVLYPALLRDLLLELRATGAIRAYYSGEILDEVFASLARQRPQLIDQLARTRSLLEALPDALVSGHMALVGALELPDRDDRHVLAAAIVAGAQVIVTQNTSDFPAQRLTEFGIEAQHPDVFVHHIVDLQPGAVIEALGKISARYRNPPLSVAEIVDRLEHSGLVQTAVALRPLIS